MALVYNYDTTSQQWKFMSRQAAYDGRLPAGFNAKYCVLSEADFEALVTTKGSRDAAINSDWTELRVYPTKVTTSHEFIARAWNSPTGIMNEVPIADKLRIDWTFESVKREAIVEGNTQVVIDYSIALSHYINKNRVTNQSNTFYIKSWCDGVGYVFAKCYCGYETKHTSEGVNQAIKGLGAANSFEIAWVEVGDETTVISNW